MANGVRHISMISMDSFIFSSERAQYVDSGNFRLKLYTPILSLSEMKIFTIPFSFKPITRNDDNKYVRLLDGCIIENHLGASQSSPFLMGKHLVSLQLKQSHIFLWSLLGSSNHIIFIKNEWSILTSFLINE
jgi:hypothetical protein